MRINRPIAFVGTEAEISANFNTHDFMWDEGGDTRCANCDCRPSHRAANWPCGEDVPRETVEI